MNMMLFSDQHAVHGMPILVGQRHLGRKAQDVVLLAVLSPQDVVWFLLSGAVQLGTDTFSAHDQGERRVGHPACGAS